MKPGTQIIYVPLHADGDPAHPDCECGFVVSEHPSKPVESHFCRYWRKGSWGILRTVANSESTPNECLIECVTGPQGVVDICLRGILAEQSTVNAPDWSL